MTDQELEAMYARIRMFKRESNMNERDTEAQDTLKNLNSILTHDFNKMLQRNAVLQRERDEALALSEARNVEMERALKQSRENNEVALEWQRRYELETIICERVMAERDKAESALREAIAKIEKLLQLRPNVGVKKEQ